MIGYGGANVNPGNADFLTSLSTLLLEGGLRPDQVAIGVPSTSKAAGSGYITTKCIRQIFIQFKCNFTRYRWWIRKWYAYHIIIYFIITMAPETYYIQTDRLSANDITTAYYRLALEIKDILTICYPQFYNSGGMIGYGGANVNCNAWLWQRIHQWIHRFCPCITIRRIPVNWPQQYLIL